MLVSAAVVRERNQPFIIQDVELDAPQRDEVLVRIVATGVCHTDLSQRESGRGPWPAVFGHEGAGIVQRVGAGVTRLQPGDHVALSFLSCGHCRNCLRGKPPYCDHLWAYNFEGRRPDGSTTLRTGDAVVYGSFFGQSSFATYALASERNAVKVRTDVPLALLGPLGCGIQTGAGAVLNTLHPPAGSSIAVFGAGSVGLSAIMAAVVAGCTTIIAIDVKPNRLALARELGATQTLDATTGNLVEAIRASSGGGTDYALDTTGRPEVIRQGMEGLATLGICGVIGGAPPGTELRVPYSELLAGRTVRGIVQGDSIPELFIPALIDLYLQGRFPFDRLITFYPFAQINEAAAASEHGETVKPVLRME
jgi:aryl-alcohol dehydrogenase